MTKTITMLNIAVEEIIVNLLTETGAMDLEGDDIVENAKSLGYRIVRKVLSTKEEFVTLLKHEVIMKTVFVAHIGDEIHKIEMDATEMINILKERDQNGLKKS